MLEFQPGPGGFDCQTPLTSQRTRRSGPCRVRGHRTPHQLQLRTCLDCYFSNLNAPPCVRSMTLPRPIIPSAMLTGTCTTTVRSISSCQGSLMTNGFDTHPCGDTVRPFSVPMLDRDGDDQNEVHHSVDGLVAHGFECFEPLLSGLEARSRSATTQKG